MASFELNNSFSKEENKEKEGIVVAVRIRPLSKKEVASGIKPCCQVMSDNLVTIRKDGDAGNYLKSQMMQLNEYAFDQVFDEKSSQQEVYERTAKPFINNVIMGKNVTVFAYGATGAGKTHTMMGNTRADTAAENVDAGIIPNAVQDVFQLIDNKRKNDICSTTNDWTVSISYMEVYNEQVYDLLEGSGKVLSVREDQERGIVVVAGITEKVATSYDDVLNLMSIGNRNRKTESTMANAVSSRSHAVLQLTVRHSYRSSIGKEIITESKLSMIDLAGSERAAATNNRGARLQEGANINRSLLALANCINALAGKATSNGKLINVKYRDSKLTHLLKSSLEGNCNLIMIANINPSDNTYEDSHNTLKYANRAKNIKVNPAVKENVKDSANWVERESRLRSENTALRSKVTELSQNIVQLQTFQAQLLMKLGISSADAMAASLSCDLTMAQSLLSSTDTDNAMLPPSKDGRQCLYSGQYQQEHEEDEYEGKSASNKKRKVSNEVKNNERSQPSRDYNDTETDDIESISADAQEQLLQQTIADYELSATGVTICQSSPEVVTNITKRKCSRANKASSAEEVTESSSQSNENKNNSLQSSRSTEKTTGRNRDISTANATDVTTSSRRKGASRNKAKESETEEAVSMVTESAPEPHKSASPDLVTTRRVGSRKRTQQTEDQDSSTPAQKKVHAEVSEDPVLSSADFKFSHGTEHNTKMSVSMRNRKSMIRSRLSGVGRLSSSAPLQESSPLNGKSVTQRRKSIAKVAALLDSIASDATNSVINFGVSNNNDKENMPIYKDHDERSKRSTRTTRSNNDSNHQENTSQDNDKKPSRSSKRRNVQVFGSDITNNDENQDTWAAANAALTSKTYGRKRMATRSAKAVEQIDATAANPAVHIWMDI